MRIAGEAGYGLRLGAKDRCWTVVVAEMSQRDLGGQMLPSGLDLRDEVNVLNYRQFHAAIAFHALCWLDTAAVELLMCTIATSEPQVDFREAMRRTQLPATKRLSS